MNSRFIIMLIGTFACGFLCAWLLKPRENPSQLDNTSAKSESRSQQRVKPNRREISAMRSADSRIVRLLDNGETWRPEESEDYPNLVKALQRRAGFNGLDTKGERLLENIVISWYDSEPDAALYWALSLGNLTDEGTMMSAIIDHCAKSDWQAAVLLAEQHGAAAGRSIYMPRRLATEIMQTLSPAEFVRIDRMFSGTDPASPSGMIQVGEDFRFAETLDLYGADKKPQVLLEAWARNDFGAAWKWASDRDEPQFKNDSSLRAMAGIWAYKAKDDQIAAFTAYLMDDRSPAGASDRNLEIAWRLLKERPDSDVLQSVLAQAPGKRQNNLNRLLRIGTSGMKFGKENQILRNQLLTQMTTEERLAAFDAVRGKISSAAHDMEKTLTQLGHSPEEIQRMLQK